MRFQGELASQTHLCLRIKNMKFTYKKWEVEITAVFDTSAKVSLTPIVMIGHGASPAQHWLTTNKTFSTVEDAEAFGEGMAKEWIDAHT